MQREVSGADAVVAACITRAHGDVVVPGCVRGELHRLRGLARGEGQRTRRSSYCRRRVNSKRQLAAVGSVTIRK